MVGARVRQIYDERAKERMVAGGKAKGKENLPYPSGDKGQSRDRAAAAVGVSGKSVEAKPIGPPYFRTSHPPYRGQALWRSFSESLLGP